MRAGVYLTRPSPSPSSSSSSSSFPINPNPPPRPRHVSSSSLNPLLSYPSSKRTPPPLAGALRRRGARPLLGGAPLRRFCGLRRSESASIDSPFENEVKEQLDALEITVKDGQKHGRCVRSNHPQNADLPPYYSKREKKPFPIPIVELRRAARERLKKAKGKPRRPTLPPRNGMLVRSLIPVAYEVMNARISLSNNLRRLMKVVPVQACKHCNEIHVGSTGHPFKTCRGMQSDHRKGQHEWTRASLEDVFVPIEAYHLFDRLGKRISHEERFSIPRIPAIVELCIQAGVDLPDLPTKRRRKPVIRVGKSEIIDADEDDLPDPEPDKHKKPIIHEIPESEIFPPSNSEETTSLSKETLEGWETLREGADRLMRKYAVRVCGYCPEVHVGPSGHKAQNCGAFKHQQRNGQHGWQAAVLDDLIPPRYVWHMPESGEELQRELRNFYGQAPAVVEICMQGGAEVPEKYKATMRLDVGIPASLREAEMVV
ncbi:APO protein 2, chloroplastic-like isoform X2 [Ananas comosus]|uniref:APO protein 2, chloroplastic-like isoform X2 n=1 Tax=Ananas comosus TaxID=4615 RepID=A0A6P5G253_ANACO|nr:APO protein 2, chloroplastic-like isoform X2 [Ananas comosus]